MAAQAPSQALKTCERVAAVRRCDAGVPIGNGCSRETDVHIRQIPTERSVAISTIMKFEAAAGDDPFLKVLITGLIDQTRFQNCSRVGAQRQISEAEQSLGSFSGI